MAYRRTSIAWFALGNRAYVNSLVTFYKVDPVTKARLPSLVTLYDSPTSDTTQPNPQTLDGDGRFAVPIYVDEPVVAVISGAEVGSHETGVLYPLQRSFVGTWTTATVYRVDDIVTDGAAGTNTLNLYSCAVEHTSGTWATDLAASRWALMAPVGPAVTAQAAAAASAVSAAAAATSAGASATSAASSAALLSTVRQIVEFPFSGGQTAYTFAGVNAPSNGSLLVSIDGVTQPNTAYSYANVGADLTITFSEAVPSGAAGFVKVLGYQVPLGTVNANMVPYSAPGTGAVARLASDKLGEVVSVKDFGATGDGVTNDAAAIQAALTAAASLGKDVLVPAGTYRCSATIAVPANVMLFGEGGRHGRTRFIHSSAAIATPLFTLAARSRLRGVYIVVENTNRVTPTVTPPTISFSGSYPVIEDIRVTDAYIAVGTGAPSSAVIINGLHGFVHHRLVHLAGTLDVSYVSDLHSQNPDGVAWNTGWYSYTNKVLVEVDDCDGIYGDKWFTYSGRGLFKRSGNNNLLVDVVNFGAEGFTHGIELSATSQGEHTVAFTNGYLQTNNRAGASYLVSHESSGDMVLTNVHMGASANAVYVQVNPPAGVTDCNLRVIGCDFQGASGSTALKKFAGGTLTVEASNFDHHAFVLTLSPSADTLQDTLAGTGAQTVYTLSSATEYYPGALTVAVDGTTKTNGTDYTISGTTLTFVSAPAAAAVITVTQKAAAQVFLGDSNRIQLDGGNPGNLPTGAGRVVRGEGYMSTVNGVANTPTTTIRDYAPYYNVELYRRKSLLVHSQQTAAVGEGADLILSGANTTSSATPGPRVKMSCSTVTTTAGSEAAAMYLYPYRAGTYGTPAYISDRGYVGVGTTDPLQLDGTRGYVSIRGPTGCGVVEASTGQADADAVVLGQFAAADVNSVAADKRAGLAYFSLEGTTANNRGGRYSVNTKTDAASGTTERFRIDAKGNVIAPYATAAIATNATNGFLYIPTCAGTPTGTPTAYTGRSPIVHDTTNNKLFIYSGSAWRSVTLA
jgi:hypothetical protein